MESLPKYMQAGAAVRDFTTMVSRMSKVKSMPENVYSLAWGELIYEEDISISLIIIGSQFARIGDCMWSNGDLTVQLTGMGTETYEIILADSSGSEKQTIKAQIAEYNSIDSDVADVLWCILRACNTATTIEEIRDTLLLGQ
jgi:hypothetical protein